MSKSTKIIIVILGVALSVLSLWGVIYTIGTQKKDERIIGTLYVNDQKIDTASVIFTEEYIAIPLLQILKNTNCDIQWIDSNSAIIEYEESIYTLNTGENVSEIFLLNSSGENLIQPICGGKMYRHILSDDIVLDYPTLRNALRKIDPQLDFVIDRETPCVMVTTGQKTGDGLREP